MEEKEGRLLRCEEWNERDRGRRDEREQGDGPLRSLYYGCRPPLPGDGAEQDARLLGNLGDAKPSVVR